MDPASTLLDVLHCSARIECDAAGYGRLADAVRRVDRWDDLPALAEIHGLAPLLQMHLRHASIPVPSRIRRQLDVLTIRHRDTNRLRMHALGEILAAFDKAGITALVLKGAALANLIYPSVGLRPMSDLDILVEPGQARHAQIELGRLGFNAPLTSTAWATVGRQHLPTATRQCDSQAIHVEIHHDALSPDQAGSLRMDRLIDAPRRFSVEGRPAYALSHADMLYHLCCHLTEAASVVRLIWIADIVGYAGRFCNEIDWPQVRDRYPSVVNTLSLLHQVTPMPAPLLRHVTPATISPKGMAVTIKPWRQIGGERPTYRAILRDLFYPSDWWLRVRYAVEDRRSLFWCRWFQHPLRLSSSIMWRVRGYVAWRARAMAGAFHTSARDS
jgi:hypothetical protein